MQVLLNHGTVHGYQMPGKHNDIGVCMIRQPITPRSHGLSLGDTYPLNE